MTLLDCAHGHHDADESGEECVVCGADLSAAEPEPIYVCTFSHDWNENRFIETDEEAFRRRIRDEFDAEPEDVVCDSPYKSIQFFTIDRRTMEAGEYP